MRAHTAALILVLALVPGAAIAEDLNVTGQAMGNSDAILVHVGLTEPNNVASWGLGLSHRPETDLVAQSTSFGIWGQLSTDVQLVQPGVMGMWAGLTAKPFIGMDVLFDIDNDKIFLWPGAGVRIAPTETMSFLINVIYPVGNSDNTSPLPTDDLSILYGVGFEF